MGKLRKKICRKMAAVLSVCMMLVSVAPLIGYECDLIGKLQIQGFSSLQK